jgi:tRNA (cytidine/uridine-2'-O-)-methyltransferase
LDYGPATSRGRRHASLGDFLAFRAAGQRRLVLLSTRAGLPYHRAVFRGDDVLMLGRESAGVPDSVHELADLRVRVPLRPGLRSLNVATAAAIVVGEALRQTGELDRVETDSGAAGER